MAAVVNARSTLADILSVPRSAPCGVVLPAPAPLEPPVGACASSVEQPEQQRAAAAATREVAEVSTSCVVEVVTAHVESAAEPRAHGDEAAREAEAQHREEQAAAAETSRQDDGDDEEDTPVATKAKPRRPKRRDPCALEAGGEPPTDRKDELTWCPVRIYIVLASPFACSVTRVERPRIPA